MKLEVGKYYKDRGGEVVKIIKCEEDKVYPYSDNEGETYQENGRYYKSLSNALHDLIEEVIPVPAYRVKAEQTDMRDFVRLMEGEKGNVYTKFKLLKDPDKFVRLGNYTYYATQVDAGYIDPITGEFVMNENKSKKLKLEVGKTYKTRGGETVKIVSDDGWDQYKFLDSNRFSYTEEGLRYDWRPEHEHNLIEEVEVEVEVKTTTTKREQPKMKYYRTTHNNTETDFPVGTIVTLFKDDASQMPRYKDISSGIEQYLYTDRLEEINVKTVKTVISPASKLVKILEDSGYVVDDEGDWDKGTETCFVSEMFYFCGKKPTDEWSWEPEWLEEKAVFDSTVNTFNARQFIVDFMKKKRELSHEAYLYQRDIDEIENEWSDEECEKVADKILSQRYLGFGNASCPFCIKFADRCDDCSYGKRHGVCGRDDADYKRYIWPIVGINARPELLDFVNNYPGARK